MSSNLGDDANTTAAITGKIAGALYSQLGNPIEWLEKLTMAEEIGSFAEELLKSV